MTTILGLLAGYKKQIAILLGLSLAFYLFHIWSYDKGFNEANERIESANKIALSNAIQDYKIKVDKALLIKTQDAVVAAEVKEAEVIIQTKVQTVTKYVDKIIVKNECADLASDVVGMLSGATSITAEAARTTEGDDRTATSNAL